MVKISKFSQLPVELPSLFQQRTWLLRRLHSFLSKMTLFLEMHARVSKLLGSPRAKETRLKTLDSTRADAGENLRFSSAFFLALRTR